MGRSIALFLATECGGAPVLCLDQGTAGGSEYIRWVAPVEGAVVYLVVDSYWDVGGQYYELDIRVDP